MHDTVAQARLDCQVEHGARPELYASRNIRVPGNHFGVSAQPGELSGSAFPEQWELLQKTPRSVSDLVQPTQLNLRSITDPLEQQLGML